MCCYYQMMYETNWMDVCVRTDHSKQFFNGQRKKKSGGGDSYVVSNCDWTTQLPLSVTVV